jgi:hypothetical protein
MHGEKLITEIYEIPRAIAARALCSDFLPVIGTVHVCRYTRYMYLFTTGLPFTPTRRGGRAPGRAWRAAAKMAKLMHLALVAALPNTAAAAGAPAAAAAHVRSPPTTLHRAGITFHQPRLMQTRAL